MVRSILQQIVVVCGFLSCLQVATETKAYYASQQGRFINRDPIGYLDGKNLYSGYFVPGAADPWGLTLIAIDGTGTKDWLTNPKNPGRLSNGRWLSHCRNFANDYDGVSGYWFGPSNGATGSDINGIIKSAHKWACEQWCKTGDPIDMVGWSRGGLAVVEVAKMLNEKGCDCGGVVTKPVPVRFMGLYDPVDMTWWAGDRENLMPDNVRNGITIYGHYPGTGYDGTDYDSSNRFRQYKNWPRMQPFREGVGIDVPYNCTHGAIGGCPGYSGNQPKDYWYFHDKEESIRADRMVRTRAKMTGVPINVPSCDDYGFPASQSNLPQCTK